MAERNIQINPNKDDNKDKKKTENKDINDAKEDLKEDEYFTAVPSSPPKRVSMDELMQMRTRVDKMILLHEVAMQEDFKLEKKEATSASLEGRVREIMEKAFWDILEEELNEVPPNYTRALTLLVEIKQELSELIPPTAQSMRAVIEEVLDLDLIRQKLSHDAFNLSTYSEFSIEIMSKLCAPSRDEHIERLKKIQQVIPLYQEIFKLLGLMKIDLANFTIKIATPFLKQHSSEIERQKFIEILKIQQENGIDGLQFTKIWLINSFKCFPATQQQSSSQQSSSSSPQQSSSSSPPPSTNTQIIHSTICDAYLSLIFYDVNTPETLLLDGARLADMKNRLGTILFIAFTFAISSATVNLQLDDQFKGTLKSQLFILADNFDINKHKDKSLGLCDQIVTELNKWLVGKGLTAMEGEVEASLRTQLTNCLDPSSPPTPVIKLMIKRLFSFFMQVLATPSQRDFTFPQGYSSLSQELTQLVASFIRVITHNQSVFGFIYTDIIRDLIGKQNKLSAISNDAATICANKGATDGTSVYANSERMDTSTTETITNTTTTNMPNNN